MIKVAFDTKSKKYMYAYDQKEEVPVEEAIRLDIPDTHIYFCFHPTKNEYVVIDAPNRQEPDAKYAVTAPLCHWIQERSITVSALLSYAIRITHSARSNIQKAIKNAPSEEVLQKKIAKQECYTELVDIILGAMTDLSDVCDLSKNHETYIEKINSMINFMCERGVKPGCKTLTRETKFSDFTYAENDAEIMNSARDIINSKMNGDELVKQWKTNHDGEIRAKNKAKQREIWEKQWGEFLTPHREQKDLETSSTSMGYNTTGTSTYTKQLRITEYEPNVSEITTVPKTTITRYRTDIPKEVLHNIPTFDGKPGELNQFLSTIESYSTMYRICKTDLVMMRARGKVHKIIHQTLQEDADVEWSAIKRKLTSNYGYIGNGIEASVKISKLSMNSEETVGKYLTRAKALVKSKLKDATVWHHNIDEADAYHVCNGIIKTGLKSRMLRRLSQFKSYKDLFNNIEEEWDRSYFMEDDFASKEDTPNTATEVVKIYIWNETTTDNPVEAEILAEVNEVYHKYGRYPSHHGYWNMGPRSQNPRAPFRGGRGYHKSFTPRYNPRHQNTMVANQAYTFNGTTPNANMSYTPGTFNMGAPFNMYQVPYNQQQNQNYPQNQHTTTTHSLSKKAKHHSRSQQL